jgi:uncharacterized protein (TIGR00297 family)
MGPVMGPGPAAVAIVVGLSALAFGGAAAAIADRVAGGWRLPWNPKRTPIGLAAFFIAGRFASLAILEGATGAGTGMIVELEISIAMAAAAVASSLPLRLGRAAVVPAVAAGSYALLELIERPAWKAAAPGVVHALPGALAANAVLAGAAYLAGAVSLPGALAGILLGGTIQVFGGASAFALLALFLLLAFGATRAGRASKEGAGIAEGRGGRRGAAQAFANIGAAAIAAVLVAASREGDLAAIAVSAALASASGDTVASEIGKAFARTTRSITSFERVPRGTEGAVSLVGTAAGAGAALAIAAASTLTGFTPAGALAAIALGGFFGMTLDSFLGALCERRGWIGNDEINFLNTLAAAGFAVAFTRIAAGS